ncbi:MAG: cytochrome c [Thiohalomonadales bacterium]
MLIYRQQPKYILSLFLFVLTVCAITYAEISTATDKTGVPFTLSKGLELFNKNCSGCHGRDLLGTKKGPPFLHAFYKPSHHGDSAFYRAALKGVTAHHWRFGNMPPVKGITVKELDAIIPYIRWIQKDKGLF